VRTMERPSELPRIRVKGAGERTSREREACLVMILKGSGARYIQVVSFVGSESMATF